MKKFLFIFFVLICCSQAFAQKNAVVPGAGDTITQKQPFITADTLVKKSDTLAVKKKHSAKTATLLSLAVPGLGQCYNKKYWKVPIIYGGFAALTYGIIFNGGEYSRFKTAYGYRVDGDSLTIDEFEGGVSNGELLTNMESYRRNRDLCYIGVGLLYVMNLIDAAVDAHLFDFDVSDDLSMKIQPEFKNLGYNMQPYTGARVTFVLK